MSDPTQAEIQALFNAVLPIIEGKPGNLVAAVISNLVAATSVASMANGKEPYSVARDIYKNSKLHIKRNLDGAGMLTKLPKGIRAN